MSALAKIMARHNDNRVEAARECINIATRFPQFADEYNDYAQFLLTGGETRPDSNQ